MLIETVQRFQSTYQNVNGFSVTNINYLYPTLPNFLPNQSFIFTSQYGVKCLGKLINPTNSYNAFCVGKNTAYYAQKIGFYNVEYAPQENAQSLACLIQKKCPDDYFMFCTGKKRKNILEYSLNQYNIQYKILELYDAVQVANLPIQIINKLSKVDTKKVLIICFSMRNATLCYELMMQDNFIKQYIQDYQWHIIGQETEFKYKIKDLFFYRTPSELYNYFLV